MAPVVQHGETMTRTVLTHRTADGWIVTEYPSKAAAHKAARELRAAGADAYIHEKAFYEQFIAGQMR